MITNEELILLLTTIINYSNSDSCVNVMAEDDCNECKRIINRELDEREESNACKAGETRS